LPKNTLTATKQVNSFEYSSTQESIRIMKIAYRPSFTETEDITEKQYTFLTEKMHMLPEIAETFTAEQAHVAISAWIKSPPISDAQYRFLRSLGATRSDIQHLTKLEATELIKRLKNEKKHQKKQIGIGK
jgi:uncharacterized FlgJ-related protein